MKTFAEQQRETGLKTDQILQEARERGLDVGFEKAEQLVGCVANMFGTEFSKEGYNEKLKFLKS